MKCISEFNYLINDSGIKAYKNDLNIGNITFKIFNNWLCELSALNVKKDFQNMGIGAELVRRVSDFCKQNNYHKLDALVHIDNIPSKQIFVKNGFHIEGFLMDHYKKDSNLFVYGKHI